jgi:undecaprenyl-diphosphatase
MPDPASALPAPPPKRLSLPGAVLRGCLVGAALALLLEGINVYCGYNFHVVLPGQVYRTSQPSPGRLEDLIRTYGIRTVVNLRGCSDPMPWYLDECRVTSQLNVSQEDLSFSAGRLPPVPEMRHLVEVIDHSEGPILFHCYKGIDRTGLASAITLLLRTDATLDEARRQLGWRYGHVAIGHTANMDRFLDLYEEWLTRQGLAHSSAVFRRWVEHDYCPGECRCRFEVLGPTVFRQGEPSVVRVRSHNTSVKPWRMRAGTSAGIHALYRLFDAEDRFVAGGNAGLFNHVVPAGASIDLTFPLPPLPAGRYLLRADMIDEQHAVFFQTGCEPLEWEVEVW